MDAIVERIGLESAAMDDGKFTHYLKRKIQRTIRKYKLFTRRDKIAVAASGGKDSTVLLLVLKKLGFSVEAISIDVRIGCYTEENLNTLRQFCGAQQIPLHVFSFIDEFEMSLCFMREVLKAKGSERSSCHVCGILRRNLLNRHARELGFTVLATGHNLDDEAQSFIMNVFRNDFPLAARQGPSSPEKGSGKFVRRVKPLFFIEEREVIRYAKIHKLPVKFTRCPCSLGSFRVEHRGLLDEIEKTNPHVKHNIVKFQEALALLAKDRSHQPVGECTRCGEPASGKICKTCQILEEIEKKTEK